MSTPLHCLQPFHGSALLHMDIDGVVTVKYFSFRKFSSLLVQPYYSPHEFMNEVFIPSFVDTTTNYKIYVNFPTKKYLEDLLQLHSYIGSKIGCLIALQMAFNYSGTSTTDDVAVLVDRHATLHYQTQNTPQNAPYTFSKHDFIFEADQDGKWALRF